MRTHVLFRRGAEDTTILKLRRCRISGFKALQDVSFFMRDDLLILIGNNGAGKSSTIQALAFVKDFLDGSPEAFFDARGWSRRDVKTQLGGTGNTLRLDLLFDADDGSRILWQLSWGLNSGNNLQETIWSMRPADPMPQRIVSYRENTVASEVDPDVALRGLVLKGSMISAIEVGRSSPARRCLEALSGWGSGIVSLELLSPRAMREGTRGKVNNIGARGEQLASFLAGLNASRKARIVDRLSLFYPLDGIDTTRKRAGWVDLRIAESFGIGPIGTSHISDGFLRLLALCALPEFGSSASLILLDEIEDGIEPHILPDLMRRIIDDASAQFIVTSHSPLLVNFFDPQDVALIGRRRDGSTMAASLGHLPSVRTGLEYFGGGEMWANMGSETLDRELGEAAGRPGTATASRSSRSSARAFMTTDVADP